MTTAKRFYADLSALGIPTDRIPSGLYDAMRERGLDVLVAVADAHHKGNVRYLTDHDIWSQRAYVVVPLEQDPTLIVSMNSQQYWARKRGWIEDVRSAPRPVEAVASLLAERGLARAARIGIGGMTDLMSVGDMRLLTDVLPGTAFEDATTLVQGCGRTRATRNSPACARARTSRIGASRFSPRAPGQA